MVGSRWPITFKFVHSHLTRPMHALGLASMGLGSVCLLLTVWMKWQWHQWMTGNPLLLWSVMLEPIGV